MYYIGNLSTLTCCIMNCTALSPMYHRCAAFSRWMSKYAITSTHKGTKSHFLSYMEHKSDELYCRAVDFQQMKSVLCLSHTAILWFVT